MNDNRLNGPCCRGTPTGPCGALPTRPYPGGAFCPTHSPAALAGHPEPVTPAQQKGGQTQ